MESFGSRLCSFRKEKGLSQEKFAEIMGVSRQSISKWENDVAYPELPKIIFMAQYFNTTLDYLVLGNVPVEKIVIQKEESAYARLSKSFWSFIYNLDSDIPAWVIFWTVSIFFAVFLIVYFVMLCQGSLAFRGSVF